MGYLPTYSLKHIYIFFFTTFYEHEYSSEKGPTNSWERLPTVCGGCLLRRSRLLEKTLTNLLSLFLNLNPACWPCCLDPPPTSRPSAPAPPPVPQRTQAVRPQIASAPRTPRRSPPPALVKTPAATAQTAAVTLLDDAACVPLKAPLHQAAPASTGRDHPQRSRWWLGACRCGSPRRWCLWTS